MTSTSGSENNRALLRPSWILAVIALAFLCGCTHARLDLTGIQEPVCTNDPVPLDLLELKHFQERLTGHSTFFGLVPIHRPDIRGRLQELMERYHGNGMINLKVTEEIGPIQGLFDIMLFPLWTTRSYLLEGDVVRIVSP